MAGPLSGSGTAQDRPGLDAEQCRAFWATLPVHGLAAGLARPPTRDPLADWSLGHLEVTAVLLVSELLSNAVRHARTGLVLELGLETYGSWLRIEVLDADPQPPEPRTPDTLDESGFGFVLIEALADKWGVRPTTAGKAVWAELDTGATR